MRMRLATVLAAVLSCAAACKKKEAASASATPDAPPTGRTVAADPGAPPKTIRRAVARIDVAEAKDKLPALDGARVLREVQKARVGERLETALCYDEGEVDALAERVKKQLEAQGWQAVTLRRHPQLPDRVTITAAHPPYALTGSVQRGRWPDCEGARGRTYVTLGIHKLELRPTGQAGPPGAMRPKLPPGTRLGAPPPPEPPPVTEEDLRD